MMRMPQMRHRTRATKSASSVVPCLSCLPLLPGCPSLSFRFEFQRHAVHAVAQSCRLRAIVENMAEMSLALRTQDGGARHAKSRVDLGCDCTLERRPETRPACAAVELGL